MKIKSIICVVSAIVFFCIEMYSQRFVAITIDDLPVVSTRKDLENRREITRKLLSHITKAKVPAIGFVNEGKLYKNGERAEAEVDLLRQWLDANLELGNHTYSHLSLKDKNLREYEDDILKGEIITKELLAAKNMKMRYFRHPYLWTGLNMQIKNDLGDFLNKRDYTIAPVTIDNEDYVFSAAYDKAYDKKDLDLMKKIGEVYIPYTEAKVAYWEHQTVKIFNREIKQIFLLHANFINSDYFDDIAQMLEKRGYKFITLEESLTDEAYKLPDTFVNKAGISWLHRWAIEKGKGNIVPYEPNVPDFVTQAANSK